jgi:hypothetical protein
MNTDINSNRSTGRLSIVLVFTAATLAGCAAADDDLTVSNSQMRIASGNGLGFNGLGFNGLGFNGLGFNGLGFDGKNYNGLNHDGLMANKVWQKWMKGGEFVAQAEVMSYLVQCALRPDQTIPQMTFQGETFGPWTGVLGFAPDWFNANNDMQTDEEQSLVSACLLAHVNGLGVHVPISVRSEAIEPASEAEAAQYIAWEAHFFGNIFSDQPLKGVCRPDEAPNAATDTELDDLDRECALTPGLCEFQGFPKCSDVCDYFDPDQGVYAECNGLPTVAVFLDPK